MNIAAKIWSWSVAALGLLALLGSLGSETVDGYGVAGGIIMLITAGTAINYIWKDDGVQKHTKQSEEENRIARIVAERMSK